MAVSTLRLKSAEVLALVLSPQPMAAAKGRACLTSTSLVMGRTLPSQRIPSILTARKNPFAHRPQPDRNERSSNVFLEA